MEKETEQETATETATTPGSPSRGAETEHEQSLEVRNRLVAALLRFSGDELAVVRVEEAMAVFGVASTGAPVAVITYKGEAPEAFAQRLVAVTESQPGTLYIVVAGGESGSLDAPLLDVAKRAPDLRSLGLYHLTAESKLLHLAGRHLGALESAGKKLAEVEPLGMEELRMLTAEAQRKHAEAVQFSQSTRGRFPVVSLVLGAVSILVFLRGGAPGSGPVANAIFEAGANYGPAVKAGEIWRLLSSAFLHGSQTHLLMNMLSLYFLGTFLEQVVGRARYLLIYGLSAVAGSAASALLGPDTPSVGASGAIWGLMTAGLGLALRPGGMLPAVIASRIKRGLTTPLLINIAISFLPDIDFRAHFGGGAMGLLLALSGWMGNRSKGGARVDAVGAGQPVPTPRWVTVAAVVVALSLAASLGIALLNAQTLMSSAQRPPSF